MTRKEEIVNNIGYQQTKAAFEYASQHFDINKISESNAAYNGFEAGAEWMQKKMVDKATQWLFENVYDYTNAEDQERVESFRKYLEE